MLKRKKTPLLVIFFAVFLFFVFFPVLAVNAATFKNPLIVDSFAELVNQVVTFIRNVTGAVAVLVIIVGAWYILAAGGDANKISTGKSIIIYALLALFIVVFINEIIRMITEIFGD